MPLQNARENLGRNRALHRFSDNGRFVGTVANDNHCLSVHNLVDAHGNAVG